MPLLSYIHITLHLSAILNSQQKQCEAYHFSDVVA